MVQNRTQKLNYVLGNNFGKWGIAPEVNYGCDIRFTGDAKGKAIEVRT